MICTVIILQISLSDNILIYNQDGTSDTFIFNYTPPLIAVSAYKQKTFDIVVFFLIHSAPGTT